MDVSNNNSINIRTASFSAYLDVAPTEDHEIDVFQAEKYFNMDFDDEAKHDDRAKTTKNHVHSSPDQLWAHVETAEESSISYPMKKHKESKKQSIFSRLSCKGHCSDSESVRVSESAHVKRTVKTQVAGKNQNKVRSSVSDRTGDQEQQQFEFPVLSSKEEPRNSIEAFGSVAAARKMRVVTWDAILKADKAAPISFRTDSRREFETESCASSDLFEIDNISGACNNMSGRKELLKMKDREERFRSEKSGFLLACKTQRAVVVSESKHKDDQKPTKVEP